MTVNEKIKSFGNKTKQNKALYNLNGQTAKILALSSWNVGKYKFLRRKGISPEKKPVRKSCFNQMIWTLTIR